MDPQIIDEANNRWQSCEKMLTAHMVTLQVLFTLYQKAFFPTLDNHSVLKIEELAKYLGKACTDGKKTEVSKASQQMVEGLRSLMLEHARKPPSIFHKVSATLLYPHLMYAK